MSNLVEADEPGKRGQRLFRRSRKASNFRLVLMMNNPSTVIREDEELTYRRMNSAF